VINALMLLLTSWLAKQLDLGFVVNDFFWSALLGALVISLVNWFVASVADD
jgi:putative membrane protein